PCESTRLMSEPGEQPTRTYVSLATEQWPKATPAPENPQSEHPARIGRYRIETLLGQGGFGSVYLAEDEWIHRRVALKVPHQELVRQQGMAKTYLTEAQIAAKLQEHPHIIPVYDVATADGFPFFIVSKYIEGSTLADVVKDNSLPLSECVSLVATLAEALDH